MCQQKYGNASCSVHHQVRWWWVDMQYIIKGAAAAFILSCILYLSLQRRLSSQTSESLCLWYELRQPFCAHTHILLFSKYHLRFSSATVIYSSKTKPEGLLQFCEWQWPIVMMLRLIQFRRSPYLRLDKFFFFFTGISSICSVVFIATEPLFAKDKLLAQDPIVRQLSGTLKLLYSV